MTSCLIVVSARQNNYVAIDCPMYSHYYLKNKQKQKAGGGGWGGEGGKRGGGGEGGYRGW